MDRDAIKLYVLGLVINGKRHVLHKSSVFPPFATHTIVMAAAVAIKRAFPDATVTSFQEHGGKSYSC